MLLGIDIGGTTISLGLVKGTGLEKRVQVPSFPADATLEETLDYLSGQIAAILTPDTQQIGIGVPTLVDVESSMTLSTFLPGRKSISRNIWRPASTFPFPSTTTPTATRSAPPPASASAGVPWSA